MANVNDVKNAVVKTEVKSLEVMIKESAKELGKALPAHLNPERICRIALTCIRLNPKLATCTPSSFLGSLFVLAQLGLEPINGRAYLLPFRNNNTGQTEVQAIIGYKGLSDLFYHHGSSVSLDVHTVYENDDFSFEYGTNASLRHIPTHKARGGVIGYYAVAKLKEGGSVFKYMTYKDCLEHGQKHSKTYDKANKCFYSASPWHNEFDAMAKKTVLIQLSKTLPLSVEIQRVIQADETSRDYRVGIKDMMDIPTKDTWDKSEVETAEVSEVDKKVDDNVSDVISQSQMKRLFAILTENSQSTGFTDKDLKDRLKEKYNLEHTKDIKKSDYDDIVNWCQGIPEGA